MSLLAQENFMKDSILKYFENGPNKKVDYMDHNFNTLEMAKEQVAFEDQSIVSNNSTNIAGEHVFELRPSLGKVSNMCLELKFPATGVAGTWVDGLGWAAIKDVEVFVSGTSVIKYSGIALQQYVMSVNQGIQERTDIKNLLAGPAAATASDPLFIDILSPGQHCISGIHNEGFSVGKCSKSMEIRINFRPATECETGGTTTITSFTTCKLHFRTYKIKHTPNIKSSLSGSDLPVESFKFLEIGYDTRPYAMTTAADVAITTTTVIKNQEMIGLLFMKSVNTNNGYFLGIGANHLKLSAGNATLYEHSSLAEAYKKHKKVFGERNYTYDTKIHHIIPTCMDYLKSVKELGTHGWNIFQEGIELVCTTSVNATYYVNLAAIYPTVINIGDDGNITVVKKYIPTKNSVISGEQPKVTITKQ